MQNKSVDFITTNDNKFQTAQAVCKQFGITLRRKQLDIEEIQAEDGLIIAKRKAEDAFRQHPHPLVITDDSWSIPGLRGFPGPYMKSMNGWLTTADYLRLILPLTDRRIILRQIVVYQDSGQQRVFVDDIEGILLTKARGSSPYTHFAITSFDGGKHSAAEINMSGHSAIVQHHTAWHDFSEWLNSRGSKT